MPDIRLDQRTIELARGSNLLEGLLGAGLRVPCSCRAGHCQTCLLQNTQPLPDDDPGCAALSPELVADGWLLACQHQVRQPLQLSHFDPRQSAMPCRLAGLRRLRHDTLELRLHPKAPLRFHAGQHATLWLDQQLARSYSIASLPGDPTLAFHLRLHPDGAFSQRIQQMDSGQTLYLSAVAGHCHFQPDWFDRPLLLLGRGSAAGMLHAIARDALQQGHTAGIRLIIWQRSPSSGYLHDTLRTWAEQIPAVDYLTTDDQNGDQLLRQTGLVLRNTMALVCGSPVFIQHQRKQLFLRGLPRQQILDEAFLGSPDAAVDLNHG